MEKDGKRIGVVLMAAVICILACAQPVNTAHADVVSYKPLGPGQEYRNEPVLNPSVVSASGAPAIQRYILQNTEKGRRYFIRIAFLGSPSIGYKCHLYHVRRSVLLTLNDNDKKDPGVGHSPQDADAMTFWMDATREVQFAVNEPILYDAVGDDDTYLEYDPEDPFVAVLEIRPYVLAHQVDASLFPTVAYNIHMDAMAFNVLPPILPSTFAVLAALLVVGVVTLYPMLKRVVAPS